MTQAAEPARIHRLPGAGGRVPPHDLDAEESLLGAMLLSRDAIADAVESCTSDDFYKPAHAHIYAAIVALYTRGEPADPVTVADELRRAGLLDAVGEASVLISLQVNTPSTANARHYARIVEEHALLRRLVTVAGEIAELGYSLPDDVAEVVDRAESMVFEVAQRRVVDTMSPLRELLAQSLDHLENLFERGETITGVATGYADLDDRLAGLQKSNLVVVGARPSMGKTSLALGMVNHAAVHARVPVLLFSLEMSHLELTQRMLCSEARVDATRMRNGRLLESDWPKISDAIGRLGDAPIYIDDNPNVTVMDIRAKSRRLKAREGLGLVVVDYLQLMSGHAKSRAENRQVEVSEISRGLKVLARELDIPVVALSQLSRNLEMRQDKRPVLADLRESGCLTADTRITRADTGAEVTMGELLAEGSTDIPVWAFDDDGGLMQATMMKVFPSGVKPVFELTLASGRRVKASANHPFRTASGWRRLAELAVGDVLATPRLVPEPARVHVAPDAEVVLLAHLVGGGRTGEGQAPRYVTADIALARVVEEAAAALGVGTGRERLGRWWTVVLDFTPAGPPPHGPQHPVAPWLDRHAMAGRRPVDTVVPRDVFGLPSRQVALFLRHLWSTGGGVCPDGRRGRVRCHFTSPSRRLVDDVQSLLLRFGIRSRVTEADSVTEARFHLAVTSPEDQARFVADIGVVGAGVGTADAAAGLLGTLRPLQDATWTRRSSTLDNTEARIAQLSGFRSSVAVMAAARHPSAEMAADPDDLAPPVPGVWWDPVLSVSPLGEAPVYDATVPGPQNFLANGIVAHNSIEQDADVVLFIYRDELYNPESQDRGTAEILVAKHRNGPTGVTRLAFVDHYTRFANMARV